MIIVLVVAASVLTQKKCCVSTPRQPFDFLLDGIEPWAWLAHVESG